jgi:peroxiredoxin
MPFTIPLRSPLPDFTLSGTDGAVYSNKSFREAKALVIFFTCNHCPYVINSDESTRQIANRFQKEGVAFIGINSNSKNTYHQDSFKNMVLRMEEKKFPWTYLYDPTQETALRFGALRTPHFFVFDETRKLVYSGRSIDSPKDPANASTNDLEKALEELLEKKNITTPLTNPIGCNVKWDGKEKHWMPPEACDLVLKKVT